MAGLSNSDKQNLTKEQQAQVAALKKQYAQAQKSGDTAAMEKAHADAEKIRSSAGYSGGTSGSGYSKLASNQGGQSADQVRQWVDDYTKAGYDKNRGWINGYSTEMNTRSKANYIRQQMQANSEAWKTADKATQDYLHQQNVELAKILEDAVGGAKSTYNASTGQWENYNPNLGYGVDVTARDMPQVANSWKNYLGYTDDYIKKFSNDPSRYSNFVDYNNLEKGVDADGDGYSGRYEAFANGPKLALMGAASGTRIFDYNPTMEGHDRVYTYNPSGYTNQFTDYAAGGVLQPNVLSAMYGGTNNTYTRQGNTVDANRYIGVGNKTDYKPNTGDDTDYYEAQKEYLRQTGGLYGSSGGGSGSGSSYEDYLRSMYGSALASQLESLKSSYEQNLSDLDASGKKTDAGYVEQKRQTTGDAAQSAANWREMANAYGLNSGAIGQANLAQSNQLQSNLNTLGTAQAAAQEEIERQRTLLGQQYQSAINEAKANNNYQLAQALYQEAVRAEEALRQQEQYNSNLALQYAQLAMQQSQWQQEFNLKNAASAASTTGTRRYSGGGGGNGTQGDQVVLTPDSYPLGSGQFYRAVYEAARANGQNPTDYLSSNYKSLGIPYSQLKNYTASAEGQAQKYGYQQNTPQQVYASLADRLSNSRVFQNRQQMLDLIEAYENSGAITDDLAAQLIKNFGLVG